MDNLNFNFFCTGCKQSAEYRRANCFAKYRVKNYAKGEHIAFKGEIARELSIAASGSINVSFVLDSGIIIRSTDHIAPSPIGAVALFSKDNRYLADTIAREECTVISVSKEEVMAQMCRCQDFMTNFIDFSASRVDTLAQHLAVLSQHSIAAKLAYYIFICSGDNRHYKFGKSIKALAEYLCVERPSLSRVISKFVERGLITYHNGEGEIVDSNGLKELI